MFKLLIGLTAFFAVVMITIGGFQYLSTDAYSGKQEGRAKITNALIGLILAIASYVILNTINPALVNFNLNLTFNAPGGGLNVLTGAPTGAVGSTGGTTGTTGITGCITCTSLTGIIPLKSGLPGTQIAGGTMPLLVSLNTANSASGIQWQVTEAYPPTGYTPQDPTGIHSNVCHANGTCVDANFTSGTPATAQNITTFINNASASGLRAVYEVSTDAARLQLISQGVPANNIQTVARITAPHFSVYTP